MYLPWTSRIPGQVPLPLLCEINTALLRHACRVRQFTLVPGAGGCSQDDRRERAVKRSASPWLSLRWFEPNTCHHLRKRPASCEFSR
jgi:hypothetical protein